MDPTVVAAWIAASVSALTLLGTLAAQYLGYRASSRDAEKTAAEQRKQLEQTLAEQRTRTWNERFATAAEQLGDDKPAAVRLAGVYAMAGLADDWEENRQTCVDVLCAYLRMPYEPDVGMNSPSPEQLAFQSGREVRHTVIRVIAAHLRDRAAVSWQGLNFDFTGVVFDGGGFDYVKFSGGFVNFSSAKFSGGLVAFTGTEFSGGLVAFTGAEFSGGLVNFSSAKFSGGTVNFNYTKFNHAKLPGCMVYFIHAEFSGGAVNFDHAKFSGGAVNFNGAKFSGGGVSFDGAGFSGTEVDFSEARDWSTPPAFPWADMPPAGVKLPSTGGKAAST